MLQDPNPHTLAAVLTTCVMIVAGIAIASGCVPHRSWLLRRCQAESIVSQSLQ